MPCFVNSKPKLTLYNRTELPPSGYKITVNFEQGSLISIVDTIDRKIGFDSDDNRRITSVYVEVAGEEQQGLVSYSYNNYGDDL